MFIDHDKSLLLSEHLFVSKTIMEIIPAFLVASEMKDFGVTFFISHLTYLNGIIQIDFILAVTIQVNISSKYGID